MSRTMKTRKLKLFYIQKEVRRRAKKLWKDIFLGNLSLNEGKNFVDSRFWILEFGDVTWKPRITKICGGLIGPTNSFFTDFLRKER